MIIGISLRRGSQRILLVVLLCQLLSFYSVRGQYLVEEFKPKIKGSPNTASHIVQDNGKIVMIGDYAFVGDTPMPNLVRFKPDGSLDSAFILSPELQDEFTTDFNQCCARASVVQGPDGDLVLMQAKTVRRVTIIDSAGNFKKDILTPAGYFQFERLIRHKDGYVATVHKTGSAQSVFRLDGNGAIDPSFNRIDYNGYIDDMIVDSENNVLLAGVCTISGVTRNLIKISESGVLDNSLNYNGSPYTSFAEIDLFPDGKIVMSSGNQIVLLDANGNEIEAFTPETGGVQIYSSVIDPANDRIIVLLEQYPLPIAVKALELDGSLSDEFAPIILDGSYANAIARILRHDQMFILTTGNEMEYENLPHSFLAFDATGTVDSEISTKEKLFNVGRVTAAVELENGNLIIGGTFSHIGNSQVNNLAKIDKSGNVDPVFVSNNPLSKGDIVNEVKISPDNQLFVGGFFHDILGTDVNSLIRMSIDGQLDPSFVTTLTSTASYAFLDDFIIMSDRIIACGNYYGNVVALDFNGNKIGTFNANIFGSQYVSVKSLCKIDEDNFAVGGNVLNGEGFLWILDMDGNIDNSFVRQDHIPISSEHMAKVGNDLYRSGQILGGQRSTDANFVYKYNLGAGAIDKSNLSTYTFSENRHLLSLNDSMVVISGKFDRFNTTVASNFVVSDYEGASYDRLAFQISPGTNAYSLEKTVLLSEEKILLLGQFRKINDDPFYSIALMSYRNFEPQVNVSEAYSIREDSSFYLSDLVEIIDLDDDVRIDAEESADLDIAQDGLVTLKQDFNGTIELHFSVHDFSKTVGPFTTTFLVQPVNDAPEINGQAEVPHILPGEQYEISLVILQAEDVEGNDLTLTVHPGDNYTLAGTTSIVSDEDFSGLLNVGVSVSDGRLSSEVYMVSIESAIPLGLEEGSYLLTFYPNPFADYIKISTQESIEQLSIHSATGQQFMDYDQAALREAVNTIQTSKLPNGVYVVTVLLRGNERRYIKLVKK